MRKRTHEEFVDIMHNINPDVSIIGNYINAKTKILVKCKKDGYEWRITPEHLLRGNSCPRCKNKISLTHEEFAGEVQKVHPNILIRSKYKTMKTKLSLKCKVDGHEWQTDGDHLLRREQGCQVCKGRKIAAEKTKTHDIFVSQVAEINKTIEIIGIYKKDKEKVKCKCLKCGLEWNPIASNLLQGQSCPSCNSISKGELNVKNFLDKKSIEYVYQKEFDNLYGYGGKHLSYDFYIPSANLLIECQGQQHEHSVGLFGGETQFKKQKAYDTIKKNYAKGHGIELLEIWYKDYKRVESILEEKLQLIAEREAI